MSRPMSFGKYVFATMRDCAQECRERIKKYSKGDVLSKNDRLFFEQLFTLHPDYKKKRGCGIKEVRYDFDGLRNNCLWIVRLDGTEEDISWRKCVRPHTHEEVVIIAFKRVVCKDISKTSDHAIELAACYPASINLNKLLKRFFYNNKINPKQVVVRHPAVGNDPRPLLIDNWLAAEWYTFHDQNTQLSA